MLETVPLLNSKKSIPSAWLFGPPISDTGPFGVPDEELALIVTLTDWPWVMTVGDRLSVVAVGAKLTEAQFFTRFVTLTEPSPVARS